MADYKQDELVQIIQGLNGLNETEKMKFAEILFLNNFKERDIKDDIILMDRVRNGNVIPIFLRQDDWSSFQTVDATTDKCSLPSESISDEWSTYKWEMGEIGNELVICMKSFTENFNIFFDTWVKNNEDDVNSAIVQFIAERFQSKHLKAESRVYFFGDSSSNNKLISATNGSITQAVARAGANPELRVSITENTNSTKITDGQVIYNYLTEAYDKLAQTPYFEAESLTYYVDRQNVQTLVSWLNKQSDLKGISCDCIDPEKVINARVFTVDNISIFGIPIRAYDFSAMQKGAGAPLFDIATGEYTYRNLFLLTRNENLLLGYEIEETLNQFKLMYDERPNEVVIQGTSKLAPGLPTDAFIIGY